MRRLGAGIYTGYVMLEIQMKYVLFVGVVSCGVGRVADHGF
jgi:hypothetical protein